MSRQRFPTSALELAVIASAILLPLAAAFVQIAGLWR